MSNLQTISIHFSFQIFARILKNYEMPIIKNKPEWDKSAGHSCDYKK